MVSDQLRQDESRAGFVISQLYYYAAAVVGVGLLLGGAVATLVALRHIVRPGLFQEVGGGGVLHGLAVALPGLAVFWWHVRRARRREGKPSAAASWGGSLYYHLVAFVALMVMVIGTQVMAHQVIDVSSFCGSTSMSPGAFGACDRVGPLLDGLIFIIVAGPVWWWHLRQGRRLTELASPS